MKFVKILLDNQKKWGVVEGKYIHLIDNKPFEKWCYTGEQIKLSKAKLSAPVEPTKIVCIGKNYHDHAVEINDGIPNSPIIFLKPISAINDPEGKIIYPKISKRVDFEGELAVIIGKKAKNVKAVNANNYIFGCTVFNDVTARDLQKCDKQWTRAKSFDTFAPVGPYVVTDLDYTNLNIQTRLNGEIVQFAKTSMMTWNVPKLIEMITECMTLYPGDIISTGTPSGIAPMKIGDTVEVEIENIGILRNIISE